MVRKKGKDSLHLCVLVVVVLLFVLSLVQAWAVTDLAAKVPSLATGTAKSMSAGTLPGMVGGC